MSDLEPKEEKVSRADLRYQPLCKPMIDAMCLPLKGEKELFIRILDHYSNAFNQTNTPKVATPNVGGSIL